MNDRSVEVRPMCCTDIGCANVCYRTDEICLNCRRFDSSYHGGYCDFLKVDTKPTNSCKDFWEK